MPKSTAAHRSARAWWADMRRQNEIWLRGDRLRFPEYVLRSAPAAVAEAIRTHSSQRFSSLSPVWAHPEQLYRTVTPADRSTALTSECAARPDW